MVPTGTVKTPVVLVIPFNVYDNGAVPPEAVMVMIPVPPLQAMMLVTAAEAVITAGWVTVIVPVAGVQLFESVTL